MNGCSDEKFDVSLECKPLPPRPLPYKFPLKYYPLTSEVFDADDKFIGLGKMDEDGTLLMSMG
jgi:hypothetical protein